MACKINCFKLMMGRRTPILFDVCVCEFQEQEDGILAGRWNVKITMLRYSISNQTLHLHYRRTSSRLCHIGFSDSEPC